MATTVTIYTRVNPCSLFRILFMRESNRFMMPSLGKLSGFPFVEPHNPASLKEAAELEALIAYKKQKALDRARQAKQQPELSQASSSQAEKTRKLRDLVDQYVSEKISPSEYYRRRELILGGTTPQDKE